MVRVDQAERDIRQVMAGGNHTRHDLCEVALAKIIKLNRSQNRYWVETVKGQPRFEKLHAEAAEAARPAPAELAERIARVMLPAAPSSVFVEVGQTHGALLGTEGLRALQALLPPAQFAIDLKVSMCVALGDTALLRGVIEAYAIPRPEHYLALANLHAKQGDLAAAIQAAEDGIVMLRWEKQPLQRAILPWFAKLRGGVAAVELAYGWFCK